jgi:hypothetical protein
MIGDDVSMYIPPPLPLIDELLTIRQFVRVGVDDELVRLTIQPPKLNERFPEISQFFITGYDSEKLHTPPP